MGLVLSHVMWPDGTPEFYQGAGRCGGSGSVVAMRHVIEITYCVP
jgi:hypothetical protein